MNAKINYDDLVRQLLPGHKRQPVRLWLLRGLASPLRELFASFEKWRSEARMHINVTGQVGVLEGYLRAKYGLKNLRVYPYDDRGMAIGLREEGAGTSVAFGRDKLSGTPAAVPLRGEREAQFEGTDFMVYVPSADLDIIESVRYDVNRCKQALVTFKIQHK